ncbi:hypothetical protein CFH99_08695 [Nocardioides aromaticivorans]|uniref:Uncharacterized protein n=1 Tax=Nocardioides aromaticivorans TaxID=200618 RepID=A0ABX7PI97_9ACTN|nr:hypothetical protein [Nocardioides aromaticivorans]QSR25699.1 hypothetical protein CFH99_08695 [Nocardioides aromaticivorans]
MTTAARYGWVVDVVGDVAACITVVGGLPPARLMELFGADPDDPVDEDELQDIAAFHRLLGGGSLTVEPNGYQGNRPEVLVPASLAAPNGRAASVYWNENVGIRFACAEAGRMVASMELPPYDDEELGGLPPDVRALVLPYVDDEEVDPIALGSAMVHLFTGVAFGRHDVDGTDVVRINPMPASVEADTTSSTALAREYPELVTALAALPAPTQREVVAWSVDQVLAASGLADDPDFRCVVELLRSASPAPLPEQARKRFGAIDRAISEENLKEHEDDWQEIVGYGDDDDEDGESWAVNVSVVVSSDAEGGTASARSVGPGDPEWDEIVRHLEESPEFRALRDGSLAEELDDWDAPDDETDPDHMFSESRYRTLNVQQWASGTCEAAVHPDATTSVWRTVHAAFGTMDAVSRLEGGTRREQFSAELVRRFLAAHPSGSALMVPRLEAHEAARTLAPARQRQLAEWVATFLARAAGVDQDPDFAVTLGQFGRGAVATMMPATAARLARAEAALEAESRRRQQDHEPAPQQEVDHLVMLSTVASAIENACHADPGHAAARAVLRADMDLVHVALARQADVDQSFWTTLSERFGITR